MKETEVQQGPLAEDLGVFLGLPRQELLGALMTGFCQPCTVTQLFLSADRQSLSWDVLSAHSASVMMAVQPGHAGWHGNLVKSFASSSESF